MSMGFSLIWDASALLARLVKYEAAVAKIPHELAAFTTQKAKVQAERIKEEVSKRYPEIPRSYLDAVIVVTPASPEDLVAKVTLKDGRSLEVKPGRAKGHGRTSKSSGKHHGKKGNNVVLARSERHRSVHRSKQHA